MILKDIFFFIFLRVNYFFFFILCKIKMGQILSIILLVLLGTLAYAGYTAYKTFSDPKNLIKNLGGIVEDVAEVAEDVVKEILPGVKGEANCKREFGENTYWHKDGKCYQCGDGYTRTVGFDDLKSNKACVLIGGDCKNPTKKEGDGGQFKDLTTDICYSCGKGKVRTVGFDSVTSDKGCIGIGGGCPKPANTGWSGKVADRCYSCPVGYTKSGPADFANQKKQCIRKSCPGPNGYQRGDQCFKCPSGYVGSTHADWKNKGCISGDILGRCPSGQFKVEDTCYSCPSTHKQSGPLDFMNKDKQCIVKDEKCPHVPNVGWQGAVHGRCYSCPQGYDRTLPHLFAQGKHCIMKSLGTDGGTDNLGLGREIGKTWGWKLIKHQGSGKCLDAGGSDKSVYFSRCQPGNSWQQWDFIGPLGGKNLLKNKKTGLCMDANAEGRNLYQSACRETNPYQQWQDVGSGLLKNVQRGTCLDGNGSKFYWGTCQKGNKYKQFYAEPVGWSDFDLNKKWSCPAGYKRTIFPVDGHSACEKKNWGGHYRTDALKIGGTTLNYPSKSIPFAPIANLYKDGEQGWSGTDMIGRTADGPGPYMWHCPPGYGRTIHHIQTDMACGRGGKFAKASYVGRVFRKADERGPALPIKGVDQGSLYTSATNHGTVFKKAENVSGMFRQGVDHGSVFSKATPLNSVFAKAKYVGVAKDPVVEEFKIRNHVLRGDV
jgi:hypothetical protein